MNVKTITMIALMSALYVVFSLTLKIPTGVGAIALDLGYIVLTVSAVYFGNWAALVGGMGAFIESLLLSPYGVSIGWIVMNAIIGLMCGMCFKMYRNMKMETRDYLLCTMVIIVAVALGVCAKTIIECNLYSIPWMVKAPKSLTAFAIDSVVMIIGLPIAGRLRLTFVKAREMVIEVEE